MGAKFVDHNNGEIKSERRLQRQREQLETNKLCYQNNNFARAARFFVHFLAAVARLRHETSEFHALALWPGVGKPNKKMLVFFF